MDRHYGSVQANVERMRLNLDVTLASSNGRSTIKKKREPKSNWKNIRQTWLSPPLKETMLSHLEILVFQRHHIKYAVLNREKILQNE